MRYDEYLVGLDTISDTLKTKVQSMLKDFEDSLSRKHLHQCRTPIFLRESRNSVIYPNTPQEEYVYNTVVQHFKNKGWAVRCTIRLDPTCYQPLRVTLYLSKPTFFRNLTNNFLNKCFRLESNYD